MNITYLLRGLLIGFLVVQPFNGFDQSGHSARVGEFEFGGVK